MKRQPREYWLQAGLPPYPGFEEFLSFQLDKLAGRIHTGIYRVLGEYGLIPPQYTIMLALKDGIGENQVTLAENLGIDRASMVKFVDGLEKSGYALRQIGSDRRERIVTITAEGKAAVDEISPRLKTCENEAVAVLGKEDEAGFREMVLKLVKS